MSKAIELADNASQYTASTYAGDLIHSMAAELRRLAAVEAELNAIKAAGPVAWLIDWPDEPELGDYFSYSKSESGRNTPLYAIKESK